MYTTLSPLLIVVAFILLLAMVGSIIITIKSEDKSKISELEFSN
jgi:NADH:ubiquinone oxidoreductase subunit 6 (subunit J)